MIDKTAASAAAALVAAGISDGATVMIGGFGRAGQPIELIDALIEHGATELTVVNNNAGNGDVGLARLISLGRVQKMICSFPRQADSWAFDSQYRAGTIELELVPQGSLAERIRAGGAGIPAFYTPTGVGTDLAKGKERRVFDSREFVLERALRADIALIGALRGDRWGNLTYRATSRNFGPIMAAAAAQTIAQVDEILPLGAIDPETIITPGVYVDHVVEVGDRPWVRRPSVDKVARGLRT